MRSFREHEENLVEEITERVATMLNETVTTIAEALHHVERRILMSQQADVDRITALLGQAATELDALKAEVDKLQGQPGVDTTAAVAAADALQHTLDTVQGHAAEVTITGGDADTSSAAALAAVPAGATVDRVETDEFGKKEVHVTYADGSKHTVHLDDAGTATSVTDGDDEAAATTTPEPAPSTPTPPGTPDPGPPGQSTPTPPDGQPTADPGTTAQDAAGNPAPVGSVAGGEVVTPDGQPNQPAAGEVPGSTVVQPPDAGVTPA